MFRKTHILFSIVVLAAVLLSACGSSATTVAPTTAPAEPTQAEVQPTDEPAATTAPESSIAEPTVLLPEVDPGMLSGNIVSAGSSTVFPLAERMADRFKEEGFTEDKGTLTIDSIGSGAGFERFCKTGETDISNASRKIKDSEVKNCTAINRTPLEFRIGTDALAVVVSSQNDFLTDVTLEELAKIFSTQATKWSDVNPAWPNEDILRFSPGTDSGTFDYFVEAVMDPTFVVDKEADKGKGKEEILNASNIQFSEDDNVLVQGVEGSPYAIGYFGYAYFNENQGNLKALSVNGVEPSFNTAESGEYKLARPLFIYSDPAVMKEKPQVASFINFFLTYVNEEIQSVGYFPASAEALDVSRQAWLEAMK
jgi:phosphate transport system substrate-binding protein